jgi:hypothetical protein
MSKLNLANLRPRLASIRYASRPAESSITAPSGLAHDSNLELKPRPPPSLSNSHES